VGASAVLLGGLAVAPAGTATAGGSAAAAACSLTAGSITASGDIAGTVITASSPIIAKRTTGPRMFSPGVAKIASTWTKTIGVGADYQVYGQVILNSTLYSGAYGQDTSGKPYTSLKSRGSGYNGYKVIETSQYWGKVFRGAEYSLRGDGVLYRYTPATKAVSRWPGYSAVKTMALISETPTYDTFLANTYGGALYTIHIPVDVRQSPVVKKVRTSTWQSFEHLVAEKCGSQGTLLAGIDKDTGSAYLYAVGHANGPSTLIKGLGKVPGSFADPVYYLHTAEGSAPLYGE
jgi:hypothetical protein